MNPLAMFAVGGGLAIVSFTIGWVRDRGSPPPAVESEPEKELETYLPEHLIKQMEEVNREFLRTRMPPQLMKRSRPLVGYSDSKTEAVHPGIEDWQWENNWSLDDRSNG